jgi:hypothetical protein
VRWMLGRMKLTGLNGIWAWLKLLYECILDTFGEKQLGMLEVSSIYTPCRATWGPPGTKCGGLIEAFVERESSWSAIVNTSYFKSVKKASLASRLTKYVQLVVGSSRACLQLYWGAPFPGFPTAP